MMLLLDHITLIEYVVQDRSDHLRYVKIVIVNMILLIVLLVLNKVLMLKLFSVQGSNVSIINDNNAWMFMCDQ